MIALLLAPLAAACDAGMPTTPAAAPVADLRDGPVRIDLRMTCGDGEVTTYSFAETAHPSASIARETGFMDVSYNASGGGNIIATEGWSETPFVYEGRQHRVRTLVQNGLIRVVYFLDSHGRTYEKLRNVYYGRTLVSQHADTYADDGTWLMGIDLTPERQGGGYEGGETFGVAAPGEASSLTGPPNWRRGLRGLRGLVQKCPDQVKLLMAQSLALLGTTILAVPGLATPAAPVVGAGLYVATFAQAWGITLVAEDLKKCANRELERLP